MVAILINYYQDAIAQKGADTKKGQYLCEGSISYFWR